MSLILSVWGTIEVQFILTVAMQDIRYKIECRRYAIDYNRGYLVLWDQGPGAEPKQEGICNSQDSQAKIVII